jgi:hypothetical protein
MDGIKPYLDMWICGYVDIWIFGYLNFCIFAEYSSERWSIPKGADNLLMEDDSSEWRPWPRFDPAALVDEPSHKPVLNNSSATGRGSA